MAIQPTLARPRPDLLVTDLVTGRTTKELYDLLNSIYMELRRIEAKALPLTGGTLTGNLKLPDGTQAAPSLSWTGSNDSDTGFFHLGDGIIGITCNNVLVGRFLSTGLEVIKITQTT